MAYRLILLLLGVLVTADWARPAPDESVCLDGKGDYVIIVHGLTWFRDPARDARQYFHDRGYSVVSVHYESRKIRDVAEAVESLHAAVAKHCTAPGRRVHFIGHSLGAIVIRKYLAESRPSRLGRVVLMGCPNHGTDLADALTRLNSLQRIFGPVAAQLGTGRTCLPQSLGPARFAPGVIMGSRSVFPLLSPFLPGPDDGVVAVESGRIDGMVDFKVLPTTHTYLPRCPRALSEAEHFFRTGRFQAESPRRWRRAQIAVAGPLS